jgi:hypothetical protein
MFLILIPLLLGQRGVRSRQAMSLKSDQTCRKGADA